MRKFTGLVIVLFWAALGGSLWAGYSAGHKTGFTRGYLKAKAETAAQVAAVEARHVEIENTLVDILNHLEFYWRAENNKLSVNIERWPVSRYLHVKFAEDGIPDVWNLSYPKLPEKEE